MTSPGDRIKVTFNAIDTAASDTHAIANQINQQLDDLKGYLSPLVATWAGQAATDYQALQKEWDTCAAELNQILHQIAATLRTTSDNYSAAEQGNTSIWTR